jgi:hypothetical protein
MDFAAKLVRIVVLAGKGNDDLAIAWAVLQDRRQRLFPSLSVAHQGNNN